MSAAGVADTVIHAIEKGNFDAIIMNFANADMVGHSGKLEATIKAVETVDDCLGRIFQALAPARRRLDHHRRPRQRRNHDRSRHRRPAHLSHHQSRAIHLAQRRRPHATSPGGSLRDIAPTLLGVLGVPEPTEMTGRDLRVPKIIWKTLEPAENIRPKNVQNGRPKYNGSPASASGGRVSRAGVMGYYALPGMRLLLLGSLGLGVVIGVRARVPLA